MKNINSVMGFNKYTQLQNAASAYLDEKKAERLENENLRAEYTKLTKEKVEMERELARLNDEYNEALNYANDHKQQYEQLKEGRNSDEVIRDKMRQIEESINGYYAKEKNYRQDAEAVSKELELKVFMPKLANVISTEVELILNEKEEVASARIMFRHFPRVLTPLQLSQAAKLTASSSTMSPQRHSMKQTTADK